MSFWTQVIIMLATAIFIAKLYYIRELLQWLKHTYLVFCMAYLIDAVKGVFN